MSGFATAKLRRDGYLGGRVQLWQPRRGYRAGVDPVLLAASVPAVAGQEVLDLGCGAGAAALCLGARVAGLSLMGVERAADMADLARRNGLEVVTADLTDLPMPLRARQFDHVLANPPYFDRAASRASDDPQREAAHGAQTPLAAWIKAGAKRLRPKGMLHVIHRAERLPDLLHALPSDMGSIEVLPLTPRAGRDADRVILRARKGARGAFRMAAPLVMHQGAAHLDDRLDDYTGLVRDILRAGAALKF